MRTTLGKFQRLYGAALVVVGCAVLVIDVERLDAVVLSVSHRRGIHLSDALGGIGVLVGIIALWTAPPRG